MRLVLLLLCVAALCAAQGPPPRYTGTVYMNGPTATFVPNVEDPNGGAAYAVFEDGQRPKSENGTGWGILYLNTNANGIVDDNTAMYAAGYLESSLTWKLIYDLYLNYNYIWFGNATAPVPAIVNNFISTHITYVRQSITNNTNDPYWSEVNLIFRQFDGLVDGYNAAAMAADATKTLTAVQLYMLNANGDMSDVITALNSTNITGSDDGPDDNATIQRLRSRLHRGNNSPIFERLQKLLAKKNPSASTIDFRTNHCSSLVRVAPGNNDLFFGHDTWASFGEMVRVYKHYNFPLKRDPTRKVSFSSSAGFLSSVDDWYITSKGLTISETTNEFYNNTMYSAILSTGSIFSWVRAMLANYNAKTGPEWVNWFVPQNSGTYNNQWIIVDNKLFSPGMARLPDNLLTIVEVLPNYYESADVTDHLRNKGFWASYNVPYFPFIYNISGFMQMYLQNGNAYSYTNCPRALIFGRDAPNVVTFDDFKTLMTSNNWQRDPYSLNSPSNAIMARSDLDPVAPTPFGGIDSKCTSWARALQLSCDAMNGPTHQTQAPFDWGAFPATPHFGQPQLYNFDFIPVAPSYRPTVGLPAAAAGVAPGVAVM